MNAERSSCERFDSSLSEKMAAVPAIDSTTMNSNWNDAHTEQSITSSILIKKAVRESKNTITITGSMASGTR